MTEQEKFDRAVNVLVQAYLNDTLEKGNCQACAIGNLIAHAAGAKYSRKEGYRYGAAVQAQPEVLNWLDAICTGYDDGDQTVHKHVYLTRADIRQAFDSTGYSFEQLALIEYAFESNNGDNPMASDAEREFAGLMAVVDVLVDIHGLALAFATQAKALFVRA